MTCALSPAPLVYPDLNPCPSSSQKQPPAVRSLSSLSDLLFMREFKVLSQFTGRKQLAVNKLWNQKIGGESEVLTDGQVELMLGVVSKMDPTVFFMLTDIQ